MNRSKIARDAARKARADARAGRSKKGATQSLSGKLTPAQTRNPKINELYIVEGNSAGGTAKKPEIVNSSNSSLRGRFLILRKLKQKIYLKMKKLIPWFMQPGAGVGAGWCRRY